MLKTDKQIKEAIAKQEQAKQLLDKAIDDRNSYVIKLLNNLPNSTMLNINTPTLVGAISSAIELANKPDKSSIENRTLEDWHSAGRKFCKTKTRSKNAN